MLVESIIPEFHNPETEIIPLVNKNISMKSIFKKSKINEINLKKQILDNPFILFEFIENYTESNYKCKEAPKNIHLLGLVFLIFDHIDLKDSYLISILLFSIWKQVDTLINTEQCGIPSIKLIASYFSQHQQQQQEELEEINQLMTIIINLVVASINSEIVSIEKSGAGIWGLTFPVSRNLVSSLESLGIQGILMIHKLIDILSFLYEDGNGFKLSHVLDSPLLSLILYNRINTTSKSLFKIYPLIKLFESLDSKNIRAPRIHQEIKEILISFNFQCREVYGDQDLLTLRTTNKLLGKQCYQELNKNISQNRHQCFSWTNSPKDKDTYRSSFIQMALITNIHFSITKMAFFQLIKAAKAIDNTQTRQIIDKNSKFFDKSLIDYNRNVIALIDKKLADSIEQDFPYFFEPSLSTDILASLVTFWLAQTKQLKNKDGEFPSSAIETLIEAFPLDKKCILLDQIRSCIYSCTFSFYKNNSGVTDQTQMSQNARYSGQLSSQSNPEGILETLRKSSSQTVGRMMAFLKQINEFFSCNENILIFATQENYHPTIMYQADLVHNFFFSLSCSKLQNSSHTLLFNHIFFVNCLYHEGFQDSNYKELIQNFVRVTKSKKLQIEESQTTGKRMREKKITPMGQDIQEFVCVYLEEDQNIESQFWMSILRTDFADFSLQDSVIRRELDSLKSKLPFFSFSDTTSNGNVGRKHYRLMLLEEKNIFIKLAEVGFLRFNNYGSAVEVEAITLLERIRVLVDEWLSPQNGVVYTKVKFWYLVVRMIELVLFKKNKTRVLADMIRQLFEDVKQLKSKRLQLKAVLLLRYLVASVGGYLDIILYQIDSYLGTVHKKEGIASPSINQYLEKKYQSVMNNNLKFTKYKELVDLVFTYSFQEGSIGEFFAFEKKMFPLKIGDKRIDLEIFTSETKWYAYKKMGEDPFFWDLIQFYPSEIILHRTPQPKNSVSLFMLRSIRIRLSYSISHGIQYLFKSLRILQLDPETVDELQSIFSDYYQHFKGIVGFSSLYCYFAFANLMLNSKNIL